MFSAAEAISFLWGLLTVLPHLTTLPLAAGVLVQPKQVEETSESQGKVGIPAGRLR